MTFTYNHTMTFRYIYSVTSTYNHTMTFRYIYSVTSTYNHTMTFRYIYSVTSTYNHTITLTDHQTMTSKYIHTVIFIYNQTMTPTNNHTVTFTYNHTMTFYRDSTQNDNSITTWHSQWLQHLYIVPHFIASWFSHINDVICRHCQIVASTCHHTSRGYNIYTTEPWLSHTMASHPNFHTTPNLD